jgi:hypothetical protein
MERTQGFDRRKLLTGAAALAGGTVAVNLVATECSRTVEAAGEVGTIIAASDHNAVVETTARHDTASAPRWTARS